MVPVKVYSAVSRKDVRFNQLHGADGGRIQQKRVCSVDGEEVPYEEIVKGYEIEPGRYVTITPAELEGVAAERTRRIEIEEFVALDDIDPIHWESTYYLAPDKTPRPSRTRCCWPRSRAPRASGSGASCCARRSTSPRSGPARDALMLSTMLFADEIVPRAAVEEFADEPAEVSDEGARDRRAARRLALGRLGSRALQGHLSRARARRSCRPRPRAARSSSTRCPSRPRASTTSWPRSRRASRRRPSRRRHEEGRRRPRSRAAQPRPRVDATSGRNRAPYRLGSACGEAHPRHRAGSDAARARAARARRARARPADRLGARLGGRSRRPARARLRRHRSAGRLDAVVGRGAASVSRGASASCCARPSTRACRCSASASAARCSRARSAPRRARPSGPRSAG